MDPALPPSNVEPDLACVVYEPRTGRIVHAHYTATLGGKTPQSQRELTRRALELAEQFGHRVDGLRVLQVKPQDLDFRGPIWVDPKTRRLVCAPVDARRPR